MHASQMIPQTWRGAHKQYADAFGFFWLPCPLCGGMFGGHEWREVDGKCATIPDPESGPNMSKGICPQCTRDGRGRPLRMFEDLRP